jgi:two-component system phosphate regulon response regulator PhoB
MPKVSGWEALKELRRDARTKGIPVIFLAGRESAADEVFALDAGAEDFIAKPFAAADLLSRINAVLRRKGPR